ncbi:MAG TPA: cell division protein ZapE [Longimicrobiaceae bacterium]|nr:cell division protein ZapE [Longimicrobiaceae bacterium]
MLSLSQLLTALPSRPDPAALVREFVPPARFADKRFHDFHPRDPSQAAAKEELEALAASLNDTTRADGWAGRLRARFRGTSPGAGLYLDGGFGVGKTHLLASLWHAAPEPKAYLSFDELVFFVGLVGVEAARAAFSRHRLAAVDEWELDDPGNLKLALAFLRGALADGVHVVVTSNTLPHELGSGRFNQKDFRSEIEELAGAFRVLRLEGTDYRHRLFEADPGKRYFLPAPALHAAAEAAPERALLTEFGPLVEALGRVHPIRYTALVRGLDALFVEEMHPLDSLYGALRWVHFVDKLYNAALPLRASSNVSLGALFPDAFTRGPYAKKLSRALSRLEEMLGEE